MLDFSRTKWTVFFLREQRKLISLSSSFYYCFFLVFVVSVSFHHPHFIIRIFPSVIRRHPPPFGQHFTETHRNAREHKLKVKLLLTTKSEDKKHCLTLPLLRQLLLKGIDDDSSISCKVIDRSKRSQS